VKELKVQPIRNGTVIDHITPGTAIKVLRILGLPREGATSTVTAAINVPSPKTGARKDIVKIEDRELDTTELNKIALIAPKATINIIREYEVVRKELVHLPEKVSNLLRCPNSNCITNHEPVQTQFWVLGEAVPVRLKCMYCDHEVVDVAESLR
jgi:aspartate carbamoyltransferase regulatory subunit